MSLNYEGSSDPAILLGSKSSKWSIVAIALKEMSNVNPAVNNIHAKISAC